MTNMRSMIKKYEDYDDKYEDYDDECDHENYAALAIKNERINLQKKPVLLVITDE